MTSQIAEVLRSLAAALRDANARWYLCGAQAALLLAHVATGIQTDLVLGGPGLEELFLARAVEREVEGIRIPVASAEDLIAMKVLGGRAKDLDDVRSLLAANAGALDLGHRVCRPGFEDHEPASSGRRARVVSARRKNEPRGIRRRPGKAASFR